MVVRMNVIRLPVVLMLHTNATFSLKALKMTAMQSCRILMSRVCLVFSGSCSEVYLERAFDRTSFRPKERLPNAKLLGETSLMFLCHPTLTEDEIQKTCDVITSVVTNYFA